MSKPAAFLVYACSILVPAALARADEPLSTDQVRALVAEMLSDAEARTSLLAGGGNAGYDKNFFVASADGNFRLGISGLMQFRYIANFRNNNGVVGPADDFNPGFQMRNTKIRFSGNIVNPDLTFLIQGAFDKGDASDFAGTGLVGGAPGLDDAIVNYKVGNGWSVRGGQYKAYFLKEENNTEAYTVAVERGVTNAVFNQGRTQGIGAKYTGDQWWVGVDITDGFRALNTDITSFREADFAATGRFEYRWAGTEDQLKDYTSLPSEAYAGMIGAAVHYQLANNDPFFAIDRNYLSYTVDGQIEGSGLSLFAAFVGSHTWRNVTGPADPADFDDFGVTVQGAWRFMQNDEVFVKYDGIFLDNARGLVNDDFNFVTFGYNHYFAGHAAKLAIDCIIPLNHTNGLQASASGVVPNASSSASNNGRIFPSTSLGLIGVSSGFEAAVRFQFQLMF